MARDEGWQGGSVTPAEHGGWADKGESIPDLSVYILIYSCRTFRGILQRGFLPRASCRYCRVPRELQD
jgi:hypothetical protein